MKQGEVLKFKRVKRSEVKKHPFRVHKMEEDWHGNKYYVKNEDTGEVWRYFQGRMDAYEFAYYSNGNIEPYTRDKWY